MILQVDHVSSHSLPCYRSPPAYPGNNHMTLDNGALTGSHFPGNASSMAALPGNGLIGNSYYGDSSQHHQNSQQQLQNEDETIRHLKGIEVS